MNTIFEPSELIINPNGSIFHLHLRPEEIADDFILVGDPQRVDLIASFFTKTYYTASNREFYAKTGAYKGKLITALSTGIGTDNIDIVLNELDALANIDFSTRQVKTQKKNLRLVRIGTSGAIQPDIVPGTIVSSRYVIGFDGLLNFYKSRNEVCEINLETAFAKHSNWPEIFPAPYSLSADDLLFEQIGAAYQPGITISANGFYGPQGRQLRGSLAFPELFQSLASFDYSGFRISNFEMECSALYGLSRILGHQALTVCGIIANRAQKTFLGDYQPLMKKLINEVLTVLSHE